LRLRLTGQLKPFILMKHIELLQMRRISAMFPRRGHESSPPESFGIHVKIQGLSALLILNSGLCLGLRFPLIHFRSKKVLFRGERAVGRNCCMQATIEIRGTAYRSDHCSYGKHQPNACPQVLSSMLHDIPPLNEHR
jgi:hypothetical protein